MAQDDTSVVVLAAAPDELVRAEDHWLDPKRLDGDLDAARADRMVLLGNGNQVQVLTVAREGLPLAAVVPLDIDGFARLEAVHRLLAAMHRRTIPPDTRLTRQQRQRARRMLQAFDGSRDGATQQDIAQILFRTGPVTRDEWQASSSRFAIMALLKDARAMVAGGYRHLLRHRRRT